jgi:hypothetical protein
MKNTSVYQNKLFFLCLVLFYSLILLTAPASATPIAVVSAPSTVAVGTAATLNGSRSYDTNRYYKIVTYSWIIQSRPSGSATTLSSQTSKYPTLKPDVPGNYGVSLKVKDSRGIWSSPSAVTIAATGTTVNPPIAKAGANQTTTVGSIVKLDGSASADPYGQALAYQWSFKSKPTGSAAVLTAPTTVQPYFTPDVAGNYVPSLIVKDTDGLSSAASTTTVTANAPTVPVDPPTPVVQNSCYGTYWRFPNVGNLQIGSPSNNYDVASFRFRAQHSGTVDSFRGYTMLAQGDTYSVGNGGTFKVTLQTDDGTTNHLPSGTVLASFEHAVNANQSTRTADPVFGKLDSGGTSFNKIYFSGSATLVAGQLYHLVFTNPSAANASNWYSMDCIYNYTTSTPMQPSYPDTDLAVVTHQGSSWQNPNAHYTPIYSLYYTDGYVQGQPYLQMGYVLGSNGFPIYGSSHKVRQPFVPSSDQVVSAVNACVYRVGSPTDLTITLQDSSLNVLATGTVAASNFPTTGTWNLRWGKVNLASPITLKRGVKYYVEVNTSGGDASNCYRSWSAENGKSYGFDSSPADGFKDGAYSGNYGQYMNGGSWQTDYYDMPIYFNVSVN